MAHVNQPLTSRHVLSRRRAAVGVAAGLGLALLAACTSGSDSAGSSTSSTSAATSGPASGSAPGSASASGLTTTGDGGPTSEVAPPGAVTTISDEQLQAALAKVDGLVSAEMSSTGVPGVAVAIVHDDQAVLAKGYGVRELDKPDTVDAQTVFQLASMSKPLSSTGIAALVGKGTIA